MTYDPAADVQIELEAAPQDTGVALAVSKVDADVVIATEFDALTFWTIENLAGNTS